MDWGNVTFDELLSSLREVQWNHPPRHLTEFFGKMSIAKGQKHLVARVKSNVYYYRANYIILLAVSLIIAFIRRPATLIAVFLILLGTLCLNDTFAASLSDRVLRLIRKVHPPTAMRIRAASGGHTGLGAPGRASRSPRIVGVDRKVVVALLMLAGFFLFYRRRGLLTVLVSLLIGASLVGLHAVFRSPNLKNRINSAREEFRAVWRGYQNDYSHDYTL
eukprot:jgi/Botrbrau1/22411/Bobra.0091s0016.1